MICQWASMKHLQDHLFPSNPLHVPSAPTALFVSFLWLTLPLPSLVLPHLFPCPLTHKNPSKVQGFAKARKEKIKNSQVYITYAIDIFREWSFYINTSILSEVTKHFDLFQSILFMWKMVKLKTRGRKHLLCYTSQPPFDTVKKPFWHQDRQVQLAAGLPCSLLPEA